MAIKVKPAKKRAERRILKLPTCHFVVEAFSVYDETFRRSTTICFNSSHASANVAKHVTITLKRGEFAPSRDIVPSLLTQSDLLRSYG
jgi:hypothetical protein